MKKNIKVNKLQEILNIKQKYFITKNLLIYKQ